MREDYLVFGKPDFSDAEIDAVTRVLRSGWVGMGPETIAFEQELSAYVDAPHVVTVNSCTSALFLSLLALGIGEDDEVIVPSLTWCATANAALYLGARAVFCDIDPATLSLTADSVLQAVTDRTRAVVVVHFGGYAVDVEALRRTLPDHVAIIEDAAHALGSRYPRGNRVGSSGNLTCFSFYANKNLSTGEGGAIAVSDQSLAEHLRKLRQNGLAVNAWNRFIQPRGLIYSHVDELGYKMNYTDLQAAIGRVQLARQDEFAVRRREIALRYEAVCKRLGIDCQTGCTEPGHARHLFVITLPAGRFDISRDEVILEFRRRNIGASIHYLPLHCMPFYHDSLRHPLPQTDGIYERIITLPISMSMTLDDADEVAQALEDILAGEKS